MSVNTLSLLSDKFPNSSVIAYDGDCPVCKRYVSFIRLKKTIGAVSLFDLRQASQEEMQIIVKEYDVNKGMLFMYKNEIYFGDKAVNIMALLSTGAGFFNFLNKHLLSSKILAKLLYPILAFNRRLLLKIMRIGKL